MKELNKESERKPLGASLTDTNGMSSKILHRKPTDMSIQPSRAMEDSQANLMTQSELFKSYSDQNYLYLNMTNEMLWFEFGGSKIGRLYLEGPELVEFPNWRLIAKYKGEFACHFTTVFLNGGASGAQPLTAE